MSGAASSGYPSGPTPDPNLESAERSMLDGSLGASPCEVGSGAAAPCAGEVPGLTEVEGELLTEESPCKKPRAPSPGRTALTLPGGWPRPPEAGEAGSDSTSSPSRFSQRAQAPRARKFCGGCRREYGVSPCYVDGTKIVQWLDAGGRGSWCIDCHRVWRTKYSDEHHLAYFREWLESDGRSRLEFSLLLGQHIARRALRPASPTVP